MTKITNDQKQRGQEASQANAYSVVDGLADLDLEWVVRFKIPIITAVSKNMTYGRSAAQHARPYIKKQARSYRDALALLAKSHLAGIPVKHNKIWLDIFVEKPHHKMDAVNVLDTVCDAIKSAIPVDDRWYSIRRLDWSVNKHDPHLFIGIGQEAGVEDAKICTSCGLVQPLDNFTFAKHNFLGRGYVCITCRAPSYPKGPNKKHR